MGLILNKTMIVTEPSIQLEARQCPWVNTEVHCSRELMHVFIQLAVYTLLFS